MSVFGRWVGRKRAWPHVRLNRRYLAGVAVWVAAANWSTAQDKAALFNDVVHPALQKYCIRCHNSTVKQSGLDLSTRESLLRGGSRGPAIAPGDARASLLYKLVAHEEEPGMPYKAGK